MQLNNSELSITEIYGINAAITKQQQEQYENAVPRYTSRPTVQKEKFDDSKFYHFVLFDIETTSTGKSIEVCQLAAVDWPGKQFSCYILPNREIDSYGSKVNKLTVKTVNGIRRLFKDNRPVEAFELSQVLRQFLTFLRTSIDSASSRYTKPVAQSWLDITPSHLVFPYFFEMVATILSRSSVPSVPSGLQTL